MPSSWTGGTKSPNDTIPSDWANEIQDAVNDLELNASNYATSAGTTTAYTLTLDADHAPTAYTDGMLIFVRVNATNTGAATINVSGLGAKAIRHRAGTALVAGDLVATEVYAMVYTTTEGYFQLLSNLKRGGVLDSDITPVGNVGTGEDDLITYTVPAGTLAADGQSLVVDAVFTLAATANAKRIRGYFGATVFYDSTSQAVNDGKLSVRAVITRTGAATQIAWAQAGSSSALFATHGYGAPAETLSGTVVLKFTAEATADDDVQQLAMITRLEV